MSTSCGYLGGLIGQWDGRVASGQRWPKVARVGCRNLPKAGRYSLLPHLWLAQPLLHDKRTCTHTCLDEVKILGRSEVLGEA